MSRKARKPDVFISYDRKSSAEQTKSLASDLESAGFSTWWDTQNMRAGDDFHEAIDTHLDLCHAAIIIWTPESIKSKWVRSEADHALRLEKLVNTHVPGLDPATIPKPFNQIHSVALADRTAIIEAVTPYLSARKRRKPPTEADPRNRKADIAPDSKAAPDPDPEPKRPAFARLVIAGLLAAGLAALAYALWPGPVPQWAFENKPFFLGEDIPLSWSYAPPEPGTPIRFAVESGTGGTFRPETCTDADHHFVGNVNAKLSWRVRAVTDCETKAPVSGWSEAIEVTQYDSVYDRIKARGEANVYVSNSQDQDVFKWGDRGFDIDLTRLILSDLSARMGRDVRLVLTAIDWDNLLAEAGNGAADFTISSITKKAWREKKFPIQFSDPYFCTTHALIYRVDTPEGPISDMMAGKLVGAQRESTNLELAELLADGGLFKVEPYKNTESLKNALRRSRIDLAVADTSFAYSAQLDTRKNGVDLLKFKEFRPEDMPPSLKDQNMQYYAVAVRKGEIQLLGAINETIAKAKQDGALTTLFNAATEEYEKANGYDPGSRSLGERPWECSSGIAGGN